MPRGRLSGRPLAIVQGRYSNRVNSALTQRPIAGQIVEAGGDYIMCVKNKQPQLREKVATVFANTPRVDETRMVAETVYVERGRIERRRLQTRDVLADCSAWPDLAQAFALDR